MYQIGDRVKICSNVYPFEDNLIGVIKAINLDPIRVKMGITHLVLIEFSYSANEYTLYWYAEKDLFEILTDGD